MSLCLRQTYEYMVPQLSSIVGYPLQIQSREELNTDSLTTARFDDGRIAIALPGPNGCRDGENFLVLPVEAANDQHARKFSGEFYAQCHSISSECRSANAIRLHFIRQEQYIWDSLVLSSMFSKNPRANAVDLVSALRESLLAKYEDQSTDCGVIATWNWHKLEPILKEKKCAVLPFEDRFDLKTRLREAKYAQLLTDGSNSFYAVDNMAIVTHWISVPRQLEAATKKDWEMVPGRLRHLSELLIGRDIAIAATKKQEIYLLNSNFVFKWFNQCWHRVSGNSLGTTLGDFLRADTIERVTRLVVDLSTRRWGALIVVTPSPKNLLASASKGLSSNFRKKKLFNVDSVSHESLCRLASLDGATIIDTAGEVVNTGVILNVPESHTRAGEGARTAAASYASTFGLAIKVSHDGPITIFRDGKLIRKSG